ncbi:thioredoxin [Maribellus maritimus]|uniref:thioredoxin n=1 Tax=Maribellus maritimus TaxID=2870838 RepID=UPI001EEB100F|nr:thioredoxin [Maribellus maritimus]MCG6187704.1 thioredoxin [Maribellus maritimus]
MNGKFQSIIKSKRPVLVDFYADWCGPCKQVPQILKEVKEDLKDKVRIIKVNVDRNPFIASKYQIKSIPTLIIFQNGMPQWTGVGVRHASELKEIIKDICE